MKMETLSHVNDPKIEETHEDDDDEGFVSLGSASIPSFEIEIDDRFREKVKIIIFSEGIQATEFVMSHLAFAGSESIGKLVKKIKSDKSDVEIWGLQYREPEPSLFFLINQEMLLCTCSPSMLSEDCYPFAKFVISSFSSNITVLILTVSAITNFKSECHSSAMETPIVRALTTSHSFGLIKIPKLEPPNILGGVAAGSISYNPVFQRDETFIFMSLSAVLTVCEIKEVPAIACVVFSSTLTLEADIVEGFTKCLHSIGPTRCLTISKIGRFPAATKCFKTGNLYI